MKKSTIKILHFIFWLVTFIATGLQTIPSFGKIPVDIIIWDYLIYAFSFFIIFYVFYFTISKKYLSKEKIKNIIIFGLLFTVIYSVITSLIYFYFLSPELFSFSGNEFMLRFSKTFFQNFETNFVFALSGSLIKIALLWYESVLNQKEIEKEKIKSELALLKTQINPKFLINTLKDFKNLIDKSPDDAILIIDNLSEIISYMLYETKKDFVELENEIKHLDNYVFLLKIKSKLNKIDFQISGNTTDKLIPSLLLLTYFDSVFNLEIDFSRINAIKIYLKAGETNLDLEIEFLSEEKASFIPYKENEIEKIFGKRSDLLFKKIYMLKTEYQENKCLFKLNIKYNNQRFI